MSESQGYITVEEGVRLYYQKVGSGSKAVIIPNAIYMFDDFQHLGSDHAVIFYDLRRRGRSDTVTDPAKLKRGIHQDVDDLEAVRRHFGIEKVDLIGHSYLGMMVVLYAMKHPDHVGRIIQIGSMQPNLATKYPDHLMNADDVQREVFQKIAELQKERESTDPVEFCKKFWSILNHLYAMNPADLNQMSKWGFCDLPNELNFMKHLRENVTPSIQNLNLTKDDLAKVKMPVLGIHGKKDRNAPYGGGREWALILPNARLVTIENAAHAPWIQDRELVFDSIKKFLNGEWPQNAETVKSL